jgi:hypothetical protein
MGVQVKGTVLLDLVKQVRVAKDKNWAQYLTPQDMELVNSEIMTSSWYPDDFFYRLSLAVYKVVGQSSLEACFAYGQLTAHSMADIYKNVFAQGDPATTIERFMTRRKSFFSTDYQDAEKNQVTRGDRRVTIFMITDKKIRGSEVSDVIMYSILGVSSELAKIVGGRNVKSDLVKARDGYELTIKLD